MRRRRGFLNVLNCMNFRTINIRKSAKCFFKRLNKRAYENYPMNFKYTPRIFVFFVYIVFVIVEKYNSFQWGNFDDLVLNVTQ